MKMAVTPTETLVREIHNEFDTAADKLLEEAQGIIAKGLTSQKADLAKKLKDAGFTNVGMVAKLKDEQEKITLAEDQARVVSKYKEKYPDYKFIFRSQVKVICQKYGLVMGTAEAYIGTIPVKNIEEISSFRVDKEDIWYTRDERTTLEPYGLQSEAERYREREEELRKARMNSGIDPNSPLDIMEHMLKPQVIWDTHMYRTRYFKIPFHICAPLKDMKVEKHQMIKDNQIMSIPIPDPVVLHFVPEGYLIVSKWGEEAEDEMLKD